LTVEVQTIRAALSKYPGLSAQGAEVVSVSAIAPSDYLEHAVALVHCGCGTFRNYGRRPVRALFSTGEEKVDIFLRGDAYRLASSMLLKFEVNDVLGWRRSGHPYRAPGR